MLILNQMEAKHAGPDWKESGKYHRIKANGTKKAAKKDVNRKERKILNKNAKQQ